MAPLAAEMNCGHLAMPKARTNPLREHRPRHASGRGLLTHTAGRLALCVHALNPTDCKRLAPQITKLLNIL